MKSTDKLYYTYRSKKGAVGFQIERRSLHVIAGLSAAVLIAIVVGAGLGNSMISPIEVLLHLFGAGSGEYEFVLGTLRLPRIVVSLLVGAALGIAGSILQGMIRNPLASPDIIGITGGATVAAVAFITFLGGSVSIKLLPVASILGAFVVSAAVYALSWKNGVTPIRLVLIGIGLAAGMGALTTMMLVIGPMSSATQAYIWMTGSVYGVTWRQAYTILPAVGLLLPAALYYARSLGSQELGDDVAGGLGVRVQRHRMMLLLISVVLAGTAVSVAGAIGFVGLIAPHLARRLVGRPFGSQLAVSALLGGLLVFLADFIARTAFYPKDIPAGVFTAGVGAPFFIYLLFRSRKRA